MANHGNDDYDRKRPPLLRLPTHTFNLSLVPFLSLRDVVRLQQTSRRVRDVLDVDRYYAAIVSTQLLPVASAPTVPAATTVQALVSTCLRRDAPLPLFRCVLRRFVGVSSVDREAESPNNLWTVSRCWEILQRCKELHPTIDPGPLGFRAQLHCGCAAGGAPCYWSSAPRKTPMVEEHITCELYSTVVLVHALSVTPYQAFFHPQLPVYAPRTVSVQFLHVDGRHCYYESPEYDVAAEFTAQTFVLPRPVLNVGGQVRFVLRGCQQRQTLEGTNDDGAALDDFYMCLSNVCLYGVAGGAVPDDAHVHRPPLPAAFTGAARAAALTAVNILA